MTTDSVGHEDVSWQATYGLEVEVQHVAGIGLRMDDELADGDRGGATFGAVLVEALGARTRTAVSGDIGGTHRGREHAVAEGDTAEGDGGGEVGVFVISHSD